MYTTASTFTMILPVTILAIMLVLADGCPVVTSVDGSCCDVKSNEFKFSYKLKPRVYNITNFCGDCELVAEGYCDSATDGGGWIVIQRRQDGSVDFNRDWVDYEDGFGSLTGEFWYGLRALHCLTSQGQWELRIDFKFSNSTKGYLSYSNFRVGPATEQYPLTISGFGGVTNDPFIQEPLNGMKFTTRDRDNDNYHLNCALNRVGIAGGWWYNDCSFIFLNHQYKNRYAIFLNGKHLPLSFIEIKMRPLNCVQ